MAFLGYGIYSLLGRGGHVCVHESDVYIGVLAHTKRLRLRKPWHLHRFLQGNFPKNTNFLIVLLPGRFKKKKETTQKLKMLNYHGRYWLGSMLRRALQEINFNRHCQNFQFSENFMAYRKSMFTRAVLSRWNGGSSQSKTNIPPFLLDSASSLYDAPYIPPSKIKNV